MTLVPAKLRWLVLALLVGVSPGCRRAKSVDPAPTPVPAAPPTSSAPAQVAGFTFPLEPASPYALRTTPAFPALRFDRPLFLTHAPGEPSSIYLVEQGGRVLRFDNRSDVQEAEVFLALEVRQRHNEEGLLGLAFDPGYADNGHVYAYWSASSPRRGQLSRFTARGGRVDPGSEQEILRIEQPYGNHNGGMIAFGPDGHLYIGVGDGGAANDPHGHGQAVGTMLGSILRIRVGPGIATYEIPPDNPLVEVEGARHEIFAYGLRNPWRFSFDRQDGTLWCGDVGQDAIEEIDIIQAGGNYGWNLREGTHPFRRRRTEATLIDPIVEYGHTEGVSVTGGYVYRGTQLADFRGTYLYGDFVSGTIWALDARDGQVHAHAKVASLPGLASFGEDAAGEVYALSFDGRIYRFEPREAGASERQFPTRLSQTGLFTDTAALEPSAVLVPYAVTVPFWSDDADKQRWVYVPPGQTVGYDPDGAWSFPEGTVTVKHFERAPDEARPEARRRLETRVMIHERGGWAGYTYRWNEAQDDAELVTTPTTAEPGGGAQRWYFPAGVECLRCHTPGYGQALGLRTRQLAGTAEGRALIETLTKRGQLEPAPGDLAGLPVHPRLDDEQVPIESRARAYLDVNCAPCHHPGGPAPGGVDLRVGTARGDTALVGEVPEDRLGLSGELRIAAGDRRRSAVWRRMERRGQRGEMPPLASLRSDPQGLDVVGRWIDGMVGPRR